MRLVGDDPATIDNGAVTKERLRADLRAAMKARDALASPVLRALAAALDNAEAPARSASGAADAPALFGSGDAETERLLLDAEAVQAVLLADHAERSEAAEAMATVGQAGRAEELRAEMDVVARYLE